MLTARHGRLALGGRPRPRCDDDCECPVPSPATGLLIAVGGAVIGAVLSPLAERVGERIADKLLPQPDETVLGPPDDDDEDDVVVAFDKIDGENLSEHLDSMRKAKGQPPRKEPDDA